MLKFSTAQMANEIEQLQFLKERHFVHYCNHVLLAFNRQDELIKCALVMKQLGIFTQSIYISEYDVNGLYVVNPTLEEGFIEQPPRCAPTDIELSEAFFRTYFQLEFEATTPNLLQSQATQDLQMAMYQAYKWDCWATEYNKRPNHPKIPPISLIKDSESNLFRLEVPYNLLETASKPDSIDRP